MPPVGGFRAPAAHRPIQPPGKAAPGSRLHARVLAMYFLRPPAEVGLRRERCPDGDGERSAGFEPLQPSSGFSAVIPDSPFIINKF